jgi:hypothetical protein
MQVSMCARSSIGSCAQVQQQQQRRGHAAARAAAPTQPRQQQQRRNRRTINNDRPLAASGSHVCQGFLGSLFGCVMWFDDDGCVVLVVWV